MLKRNLDTKYSARYIPTKIGLRSGEKYVPKEMSN